MFTPKPRGAVNLGRRSTKARLSKKCDPCPASASRGCRSLAAVGRVARTRLLCRDAVADGGFRCLCSVEPLALSNVLAWPSPLGIVWLGVAHSRCSHRWWGGGLAILNNAPHLFKERLDWRMEPGALRRVRQQHGPSLNQESHETALSKYAEPELKWSVKFWLVDQSAR